MAEALGQRGAEAGVTAGGSGSWDTRRLGPQDCLREGGGEVAADKQCLKARVGLAPIVQVGRMRDRIGKCVETEVGGVGLGEFRDLPCVHVK